MLVVGASASFAQINHERLVNRNAGGTGAIAGADLSQLENTPVVENIFGFGAQGPTTNNVMADDFTVGSGGFLATGITLFTYQTGATAPSITAAQWAIGSAATTTLTNTAVGSSWYDPNGHGGIFRVVSTSTSDSNRRIQAVNIDIPDVMLGAGTYFLSFSLNGTLASGPWAPPNPTSNAAYGQNAMQSTGGGAFSQAFVDAGLTVGADLPFIIQGQAVPEPATMAILGLGAAALLRRRRK
jgi:hypothetical protein